MDLFFLSNWQTMLLNVCDLMLSFLRRHDMLGTCDFFAEKAGCSWREYQVAVSSSQALLDLEVHASL